METQNAPAAVRAEDAEAFLNALLTKTRELGVPDESVLQLATPEGEPILTEIAQLIASKPRVTVVWFDAEVDDDTPVEAKNGPHFNLGFNTNLTAANFPNPRAGTGKKKVRAAMVNFGEYIEERDEVERRIHALKLRSGNASELADTSVSNPDSEELAACLPAAAIDEVWEGPHGRRCVADLSGGAAERKLRLRDGRGWGGHWWFLAFPA